MALDWSLTWFTFMGFLGALLYRLAWSKNIREFCSYESIKHLVVGIIVGLIYGHLHREYSFPNSIMALVAGWMGVDFLEMLIDKVKTTAGKCGGAEKGEG